MLKAKPLNTGNLTGMIYDFVDVGDILPMHSHSETDVHISVIARGSFRVHGNSWERIVRAGDVLDWQPNVPHEFISLEALSRLVNIIKG